jgi:hypothetical protein
MVRGKAPWEVRRELEAEEARLAKASQEAEELARAWSEVPYSLEVTRETCDRMQVELYRLSESVSAIAASVSSMRSSVEEISKRSGHGFALGFISVVLVLIFLKIN